MPTKNPKEFTELVKRYVRTIKAGETKSYKAVAEACGNPKAARAVARIMAANFDPTIPCHRVIRSDGTLGGYNRGGEDKKRVILESESKQYAKRLYSNQTRKRS
jgi:O-6-methylguanine DNA methyltransferase